MVELPKECAKNCIIFSQKSNRGREITTSEAGEVWRTGRARGAGGGATRVRRAGRLGEGRGRGEGEAVGGWGRAID